MRWFILLICSCLQANYTWSPPVQVSDPTYESYAPSIAIDPQGNAVAVWTTYEQSMGLLVVQASTKLYGQPWSAPQIISIPGELSSYGAVKVDSQGNAVAVWGANVGGNGIRSATKLFGQAWSVPDLVPTINGGIGYAFALDNNGNISILWYEQIPMVGFQVYSSERTLSSMWSPALRMSPSNSAIYPNIGIDANGNVIGTWEDGQSIVAASKPFGMAWELPAQIIIGTGQSFAPGISVDAAGNAMVTASGYVGATAAYKPFNQPWQPYEVIPGSSTDPDVIPGVILDNQGNAMAFWGTNSGYDTSIKLSGQSWSPTPSQNPGYLVGTGINRCDQVLLAVELNGLQVTSGTIGQPFSPLFTIGSNGGPTSVGINPCGHVILLTTDNIGMPTGIEAFEGFAFTPTMTVGGFQRKDDFGFVVEYENVLKWTVSSTQGLSGFVIYRNGIQIATVPVSKTSYVDVQQPKGIPIIYGITVLSNQGEQSSPFFITIP
jgi:hypothetical protein